jgi:hypothetical protein
MNYSCLLGAKLQRLEPTIEKFHLGFQVCNLAQWFYLLMSIKLISTMGRQKSEEKFITCSKLIRTAVGIILKGVHPEHRVFRK